MTTTDSYMDSLILASPELTTPREYLAAYVKRQTTPVDALVCQQMADIKAQAVASGNQQLAKAVWCLETVGKIQDHYLHAFSDLKRGQHYSAWCALDRCEIELSFLHRHFCDPMGRFGVPFIRDHVGRFQALFPYAWFLSPEIHVREKRCSICRAPVRLRNSCGHRPGDIYDGEMCCREITKIGSAGLSLVKQPFQKYSVLFLKDRDQHNYALVRFVVERLRSPWHAWDYHWTTALHPHERYAGISAEDPCPCGSSSSYGECCLPGPGVRGRHCDITFSVQPNPSLPTNDFSY